jgi:predicted permease
MLGNTLADIRYCVRGFAKRPTFMAIVVVTLAVGIGVNVALYSIFEGMVLRPVPGARDPNALVNLGAPGAALKTSTSCDLAGDCEDVFSYPMFRDLEREQQPFAALAAHRMFEANLAAHGETLSGTGVLVSGGYFGTLGVQPGLGRLLGPEDDAVEGSASAVVLSYRYWQNALGADPAILGRTLVVNGKPLTVVGVAQRGFAGTSRPASPDVFVPITFRWREGPRGTPNFDDRRRYWVYLFARLKPGVTAAEASAAINGPYRTILADVEAPLQSGMTEQMLAQFRARQITVTPEPRGQSWIMDGADVPLSILLVAAATVLLIACVNIANLMLARGASRVGEMAVRLSMGAAPRRLVTLLVTESVLLALAAALVSLPLTAATLRWIEGMVPAQGAASFQFGLNGPLVLVTVVTALLCALAFALFPVMKLARTAPGHVLHAQGYRSMGGSAANRFRVALVTAQIALSTMLLVLAGLLAQSLVNVARVDLGMRTESVATFTLAPERNGYASAASDSLFNRLEDEIAALPGVGSAASSLVMLLANNSATPDIRVPGFEAATGTRASADFNAVSPGFFATFEIPLFAGRNFSAADAGVDRPGVAIVNERFVDYYGLGKNAVGSRIGVGTETSDVEIVGVVRDTKYDNVKDPVRPLIYRPRAQVAEAGAATFYVRTVGDAQTVLDGIRKLVARLDPSLPIMNMQTMDRQIRENVFLDRFMGELAVGLAGLATLLAAVGLYGVLSYMVVQRTREIGLRLALGAAPARLRGMVLRQVGWMAAIGGAVGLAAAWVLGRAANVLLFGVGASDPFTLSAVVTMLAAVVFGASYLPARHASKVDPMVALRAD